MGEGYAGLPRRIWTLALVLGALFAASVQTTMAATLKPGDIVVVDADAFGSGRGGLIKVNPRTGKQSLISSNDQAVNASSQLFSDPWQVVLTPKGRLLVVDYSAFSTGGVIGVDYRTGRQTEVSSNDQAVNSASQLFAQPTGIVLLPNGKLAIADRNAFGANRGGVIGVNPTNGKETEISSNDQAVNASSQLLDSPYDLVLDGRGGLLLASPDGFAAGHGGIVRVALKSGKQRVLSSNDQPVNASSGFFDEPGDLVRTPAGKVFVAEAEGFADGYGGVIGVNPRTGKQRIVSNDLQAINSSNPLINQSYGIALDLLGRLVLTNERYFPPGNGSTAGTVLRVKPGNGKQSVVSTNVQPVNAGSSELLEYPNGVMVVPPKCAGLYPTIVGSQKRDNLRGTKFADVILGLGGNDVIRGLGAKDRICGGKGRDRLFGGKGRDQLRGGPGADRQRQ